MVMDIIKKNLVSIICGVIAIVCVVLIFFPFGGMYESLAEDVKKGQSIGTSLENIKRQQRTWPTLSSREEDKVPLKTFPTPLTVSVAQKLTDTWTTDTKQFLDEAIRRQHERLTLLVPGSIPGNPGQLSIAYDFMDRYRTVFGLKINPVTGKVTEPEKAIFNSIITAKLPPNDAEVLARQNQIEAEIRGSKTEIVRGEVRNAEEVTRLVTAARDQVRAVARMEAARGGTVYLDPVQVFKPNPKLTTGTAAPSPNDMFEAQVGLWIQQEICDAIKQVNSAARDGVLDAPIKRVLDMKFTLPYVAVAAPAGAPGEPPVAPQNEAARVTMDYARNPLGHVTSEFYDVIPFQLNIICDSDAMTDAMTRFSAGRYLMFRKVEMLSVDSSLAFNQGYVYGSNPVVQLNIEGQYLMLRKFIAPLMPPDIVRGLTPAAAAPQ